MLRVFDILLYERDAQVALYCCFTAALLRAARVGHAPLRARCADALAASSGGAQAEAAPAQPVKYANFFFFARGLLRAAVAVLKQKQPHKLKWHFFFFHAGALAGSSGGAEADAAADTEMPDAGGFVQLAQV